jgi:cob(I)alamin adenosyltransferase
MSVFKIYTKTGDGGNTSLACGRRLPKDDLRIEAYGTIDELSSVLGVVGATLGRLRKVGPWRNELLEHLDWLHDRLFTLSSMIATANLPTSNMPTLSTEDVDRIERHIDTLEQQLPELRNFILPGGSEPVSYLHLARTVCRRAERVCTTLDREEKLNAEILAFLNRLSDDLFVTARYVAHQRGEGEKIWKGRR